MAQPLWDPVEVLGIINWSQGYERQTCIGFAPSQKRRCRMQIAMHNIMSAKGTLRELSMMEPSVANMEPFLRPLAEICLCVRFHRNQVHDIVQKWRSAIRSEEIRYQNEVVGSDYEEVPSEDEEFSSEDGEDWLRNDDGRRLLREFRHLVGNFGDLIHQLQIEHGHPSLTSGTRLDTSSSTISSSSSSTSSSPAGSSRRSSNSSHGSRSSNESQYSSQSSDSSISGFSTPQSSSSARSSSTAPSVRTPTSTTVSPNTMRTPRSTSTTSNALDRRSTSVRANTSFDSSALVRRPQSSALNDRTGMQSASPSPRAATVHSSYSTSRPIASSVLTSASTRIMSRPSIAHPRVSCSTAHVARRSVDENCPVCYESMEDTQLTELVWCKKECGHSVHKVCWDTWTRECRVPATCTYCRAEWLRPCEHDNEPAPAFT